MKKTFLINGEEVSAENVVLSDGTVSFNIDGAEYKFAASIDEHGGFTLHQACADGHHKNRRGFLGAKNAKGTRPIFIDGVEAMIEVPGTGRKKSDGGSQGSAHIAPMPGTVQKVLVAAGDSVEAGQHLVVMEAMKLQITIEAAFAGKVAEVFYQAGDLVADGELLVKVDGEEADAA